MFAPVPVLVFVVELVSVMFEPGFMIALLPGPDEVATMSSLAGEEDNDGGRFLAFGGGGFRDGGRIDGICDNTEAAEREGVEDDDWDA